MTIRKQTPEDVAAGKAQIAKLEATVEDAQGALDACVDPSTLKYQLAPSTRMEADRHRSSLVAAVAEAERSLKQARDIAHNDAIYQELLTGYAENMAKNEATKAAKEAQQRGENEAELKRTAQNAYEKNGGTSLEFSRAWPSLREKLLEQKTLAALSEAKPTSLVDQYIQKRNRASS